MKRPKTIGKEDLRKRPIGVFDSGIGGLTVLRALKEILPSEDTIYLGDTARVPYGTKSKDTVIRYSFEDAEFLLRYGVKLIVVACNTATAFALPELKKRLSVPVIGVIEPGARKALDTTRTRRIAVIGTQGTIKSSAYVDAINSLHRNKNYSVRPRGVKSLDRYFRISLDGIVIFTKACPLFVPLAEEGWTDNDVARLTVEHYLGGLKKEDIDTLVLGCTHYPILKKTIAMVMGPGVSLIDSAESTAEEVKRVLSEEGILNNGPRRNVKRRFFATDSPERFIKVGRIFFGEGLRAAELARLGK